LPEDDGRAVAQLLLPVDGRRRLRLLQGLAHVLRFDLGRKHPEDLIPESSFYSMSSPLVVNLGPGGEFGLS
jgi:hypothetical protein